MTPWFTSALAAVLGQFGDEDHLVGGRDALPDLP
jgi:hypothetical protein